MSLLAYLETSGFSAWVKVSMLGFPTLIALHSVGMAVVVGLTLIVAMRLNGIIPGPDARSLPRFLTIAAWGFTLNFLTGLALFVSRGTEYITSFTFVSKMLLVIASAAIMFWLRGRLRLAGPATDSFAADRAAKSLSLVASVAWFGAVVTGRLIAYLSDLY